MSCYFADDPTLSRLVFTLLDLVFPEVHAVARHAARLGAAWWRKFLILFGQWTSPASQTGSAFAPSQSPGCSIMMAPHTSWPEGRFPRKVAPVPYRDQREPEPDWRSQA